MAIDPATPVQKLSNFGPVSTEWLISIGVHTYADVERLGAVEIYQQLKAQGRPVSLNMVWAVQGAIMGLSFKDLPMAVREELRAQIAQVKK
jgi:DNA transformation protein and related proteins